MGLVTIFLEEVKNKRGVRLPEGWKKRVSAQTAEGLLLEVEIDGIEGQVAVEYVNDNGIVTISGIAANGAKVETPVETPVEDESE